MLAAPGASLCLCFYRGLELFLLSWKQFKQGGREGTFLWGKQELECDLLGGVGLSAQQVLTGTRCCGDTEPLAAPARSTTGHKWTFQCPVSSSRVRITARETSFLKYEQKSHMRWCLSRRDSSTGFISRLNICKLFFWRSLYKCILAGRWSPPSPPSSEPSRGFVFPLFWAHLGPDSFPELSLLP